MSTTRQSGKTLEWMVYALEQAQINNPETIIRRNYKLADSHGTFREIDVYVETKVNGKIHKYAFECKDHKRGVKMEHITDFQSKIADLGIKGYFVTMSNYQKGAIQKSKDYSIDLLQIQKRPLESERPESFTVSQRVFRVNHVEVFSAQTDLSPEEVHSVSTCINCQNYLSEKIRTELLPIIRQNFTIGLRTITKDFSELKDMLLHDSEEKSRNLLFRVAYEGASINHLGKLIPFDTIQLSVNYWHNKINFDLSDSSQFTYAHYGNSNENFIAKIFLSEFVDHDKKIRVAFTSLPSGQKGIHFHNPTEKKFDGKTLRSMGYFEPTN